MPKYRQTIYIVKGNTQKKLIFYVMLAFFLKKYTVKAIFKLLPATIPATASDAALLFGIQVFVKILNGDADIGITEWFVGMFLLALLRFAFLTLRGSIGEHVFRHAGAALQLRFFRSLRGIHPRFFHGQDADSKLRAAFEATEVLPRSGESLMQALQAVVQLAVFFPVLVYLSWQLTLALFLVVFPVLGLAQKKLRQMGRAEETVLQCEGALRSELETARDIKRFWSDSEESAYVARLTYGRVRELFKTGVRLATRKLTLSFAIEAVSVIAMAAVLALCAYMISKGYMTATDLVLYSSAVFLCYKPIKECTRAMPQLRSAATAFKVLDTFEKFERASKLRSFAEGTCVSLKSASFSYGSTQVFRNFHFEFSSRRVFLLGPNGAGKTTLLKIVAGLEILDSGEMQLGSLFEKSGVFFLSQGVFLPPVSVLKSKLKNGFENNAVKKFAEVSGALALLCKPRHSGGESARIGLLWALVSSARLVLLDESLAFISRFDKDAILQCFLEACDSLQKTVVMSGHEDLPESLKNTFEYIEIKK